jgi:hypothetical protein
MGETFPTEEDKRAAKESLFYSVGKVQDGDIAYELQFLNRKAKQAFFSQRGKGHSEVASPVAAMRTYLPK